MLKNVVVVVLFAVFLAWACQVVVSPPSKSSYTPGDSFMNTRIKLRDGRHLVYKLYGVPKEVAKYKVIFIHSFGGSKYEAALITSEKILKELGVHLVSFDRPGYGESDPHPQRTLKSLPLDIAELADQLGVGSKFYLIGYSMGGQQVWGCLKYIPQRLAGVTMLTPAINFWWHGLPSNLTEEGFGKLLPWDQAALRVAHYAPSFVYWWNTQNLFPHFSIIDGQPNWSPQDFEILSKIPTEQFHEEYVTQQGVYESLHRDLIIGYGKWDFTPMDVKNPFPNHEGSVHIWQGDEDAFVPVTLQRYIAGKLQWIKYHKLPGSGHIFPYGDDFKDAIWKTFLKGEDVTI